MGRVTSLQDAITEENIRKVRRLIKKGVDVGKKQTRRRNSTLLHTAIRVGNTEILKVLVEAAGSQLNSICARTKSPMHMAVKRNDIDLVNFLVDRDVSVNAEDEKKSTPLHVLATENRNSSHLALAKVLLKNNANINAQNIVGKTPLHYVAKRAEISVLEQFLERRPLLDVQDEQKMTPLFEAVRSGNVEAVRMLVDEGARLNLVDSEVNTPLHYANDGTILASLIRAGIDVNAQNRDGKTALHLHMEKLDLAGLELFLRSNADVNLQDSDGETPLFVAVRRGNLEMVRALIDHGSRVNVQSTQSGVAPIHLACEYGGNKPIMKLLLKSGADLSVRDHQGRTPLMYMVRSWVSFVPGSHNALAFLLKYTSVNDVDSQGNNILRFSRYCWSLLLQHIAKLKLVGLPVHLGLLDSIKNNQEYSLYFEKCEQELIAAKNTRLRNCWVSYFHLLVAGRRQLKNFAGNRDLVKDFKRSKQYKKFPIFGATMLKNFKLGRKRRQLVDKAVNLLSECVSVFDSTHLVIRDLVDCLSSKKDLTRFCEL